MEALRMAEHPNFAVHRMEFDAETSFWFDVKKAH